MRIPFVLVMFCLVLAGVAPSASAGELFEEKPERGLDSSPKAQLWREDLRDEPIVVPKQARRSNDNFDNARDRDDADAEIEREIGSDHDIDHVGD